MNIENMHPINGRVVKEDSSYFNKADYLESLKNGYPLSVMDFTRVEADKGNLHTVSKRITSLADDGFARIRIKAPADKKVALVLTLNATGKVYYNSYLNSTYTSNGTTISIFNRKTDILSQPSTLAYLNPTIDILGVQRSEDLLAGSTGPNKIGGSIADGTATFLMPGDDILLEIQNKVGSSQTIDVNFIINFLELDPSFGVVEE